LTRPLRSLGFACLLSSGCSDEIVGYFESSGASGSGEGTGFDGSSTTDGNLLVPPGCLSDDFADGEIDPMLWYTWREQNAVLAEADGVLQLTPPTFGLWDTGLVGNDLARFPLVNGRVRIRVTTPPQIDRPEVIFLQILDDLNTVLSIGLAEASISVSVSIAEVEQFGMSFPAAPYPAFIAIRAEGELVHFETSDDGSNYTTLATGPKSASFEPARALIMAQTYGDDPTPSVVGVDDFEVCVQ
jgi:hypothetical protein